MIVGEPLWPENSPTHAGRQFFTFTAYNQYFLTFQESFLANIEKFGKTSYVVANLTYHSENTYIIERQNHFMHSIAVDSPIWMYSSVASSDMPYAKIRTYSSCYLL